ncbi:MAG TPA: DNA methyltransferase [Candidatus Sulfotelmatobacter sp.]
MVTDQGEDGLSPCLNTSPDALAYGLRRLEIRYFPTDDLIVNKKNARIHSNKQIKQIARSIKELGFNFPIAINTHKEAIAGNGRLEAAKLLGLPSVPTVVLDHLTPAQQIAFAIIDNKLTENSKWNDSLLAKQIKFLSEVDLTIDLTTIGFEVGEIDFIIENANASNKRDEDATDSIPETPEATPVSKSGDLWVLDRHRILCGNCLDENSFLRLMRDRKATMVFVDPPYNVPIEGHAGGLGSIKHREFAMATGEMTREQFTKFLSQALGLLARFSVNGSIHYICGDWRNMREFLAAGDQAYSELKNLCVWAKDNAGMGSFYRSQHELIYVFKSGQAPHRNNFELGQFGRYRTNLWRYGGVNSFSRKTDEGNLLELHPTVKPAAMIAQAVLDVSCRREIVLDSFLGSGSTLIACQRTDRTCYGIEIDPLYVDTIIRRWQTFTGLTAKHSESGMAFAEIEQEATDGTV